jgi:PAS domain S-box-containing protein
LLVTKDADKYRLPIENMLDAFAYHQIVTTDDGKPVDYVFLETNRAFEEMTGLKREKIIGKKVTEVLPGIEKGEFDWIGTYGRVALNGETARFENFSEPLGRWYEASAYSDKPGYFAVVFRDITDSKMKTEQALIESEERFQKMLSLVPDLISIHDPDMNIVYSNWNGFGAVPEEKRILNTKCYRTYRSLDAICPDCQAVTVLQTKETFQKEIELPEGIWIDLHVIPILGADGSVELIVEWVRDITIQKQAEDELKRFKIISDNAVFGSAIANLDGKLIYVNEYFADIHGYSPKELFGKPLSIFHTPEQLGEVDLTIARLLRDGRFEPQEIWHVHRNLTEFPMLMSGIVTMDEQNSPQYLAVSAVDITDRKQAQEALQVSEKKYRQIADNTSDVIWIADMNLNLTYVSPSIERMLGESVEEHLKKSLEQKYTPQSLEQIIAIFQEEMEKENDPSVDKNRTRKFEVEHYKADGKTVWVDMHISALRDDAGNLIGFQGVARDSTDRKLAEEEIRTLNEELEQRVKKRTVELEALNKELASFAYSISHDLRAPLRALDAFSANLNENYGDRLDEQGRHYLSRIRNAALYMSDLINDLLKLSRITRAEVNPQEVDISRLAEERIQLLQEIEPERRVEVKITAVMPARGDRALLHAALQNLLENAWKFSSKEAQAKIEVGRTIIDGEEVFFVRDNGVGFNMAYADKLFGTFQRLHGVDEFPGTGIGLATVQRIINRHGGKIWAESEVGKGATFYFTLP